MEKLSNKTKYLASCIAVLLAIAWNADAQIDYELEISGDSEYAYPYCAPACVMGLEHNEAFVALLKAGSNEPVYCASSEIIHLDSQGEIKNSRRFSFDGDTAYMIYFMGSMQEPDSYLGMGAKKVGDTIFYAWLFKFNKALEIQWEKIIDTLYSRPEKMEFRFWDNTYFLFVSAGESFLTPKQKSSLYTMNEEGEILLQEHYYPLDNLRPSDIKYIRNIPGTTDFLTNSIYGATDYRSYVMNNQLQKVSEFITNLNYPFTTDIDLEYINETDFICVGKAWIMESQSNMGMRRGSINNPVKQLKYFHYDNFNGVIGCRGGYYKSMVVQKDFFYYTFTDNPVMRDGLYCNNIILSAFSYDLDSLWTLYIKSEGDYDIISIAPMTDGSCIIVARNMSPIITETNTKAYIVKVKTPSFVPGLSFDEPEKENLIGIYPNPGSNILHIKTISDEFVFRLYDLNGKLLLERQNQKSIDTDCLPSGFYLYQVIGRDRNISSGKWIKQ